MQKHNAKFIWRDGYEENFEVIATKFCRGTAGMTLTQVRADITKSCTALGVKVLDLVAMHWWDFTNGGHLDVAKHLVVLRGEGLLRNLGVTNYDLPHLQELVGSGVPVVSNQVQFSLVDRRPLDSGMTKWCADNGVVLFTYVIQFHNCFFKHNLVCGGLEMDATPRRRMLA